MFRSVLSWLGGPGAKAPQKPGAPVVAPPVADDRPDPAAAGDGRDGGPVFSSRAVRDATVVTTAIDAMRRFAAGEVGGEELVFRLQSLTAEQFSFLQISVEAPLLQRCMALAADQKGVPGAALRRILDEMGEALPDRAAGDPLADPLRAAAPRPAAAPAAARPRMPAPPSAGPPASVPPPAAGVSPQSLPPRPPAAAGIRPNGPGPARSGPAPGPVRPGPALRVDPRRTGPTAAPALAVAPPPPPLSPAEPGPLPALPPKPPAGPDLPRLNKADAEQRRARLMRSLTDHLAPNEAAP